MYKVSNSIVGVIILIVAFSAVALAHNVADGNARTERVQEYAINSNLNSINGIIEYGNPTIRDGQWSWMALSISNPLVADCHSGTTSTSQLRVVRVGWFKQSANSYAREMYAYIGSAGNIAVTITANNVTNNRRYSAIATDTDGNPNDWAFRSQPAGGGSWTTLGYTSVGPNHNQMKCVTVGGWASSFSNAIGVAAIYSIAVNGSTWSSPAHSVINSPYQSAWIPALSGYQYSGNN